ncbi:MAG: HD-GYP domain-containing protein, partial [Woeseiaceae bacterium]|nr:HD-GYP domain-containing protein [Woeseiaceae bacterium]
GATPAVLERKPADGKPNGKKRFSLRRLFGLGKPEIAVEDFSQTGVLYKETATLQDELGTATGVHRQAIDTVQGVMERLRKSGSLEVTELQGTVTPMVDSVLRNPAALACLMRMQKKDDYLYHHSIASSVWATILGRQLGLMREDLDVIALGAMCLDVGKIQVPDEILNKPGKLTAVENQVMRRHVQFGLDILEKAGEVDSRVLEMVAHHHERYNGTGYPAGIKGNDIPVFGRIAGIVDAYDAMITQRPYAVQLSSYDAIRKLRVLADVEFQAEIIDQFTRAIGVFPTGTLVELNTGEVGIVTRQNRIRPLRPEIMVVMDADKNPLPDFRVLDLDEEKVSVEGEDSLWIELGLPPGAHGIDPTDFYVG